MQSIEASLLADRWGEFISVLTRQRLHELDSASLQDRWSIGKFIKQSIGSVRQDKMLVCFGPVMSAKANMNSSDLLKRVCSMSHHNIGNARCRSTANDG